MKPGVVAQACNPSTHEVEAKGSGVLGQLRLHRELETSLSSKTLSKTQEKSNERNFTVQSANKEGKAQGSSSCDSKFWRIPGSSKFHACSHTAKQF